MPEESTTPDLVELTRRAYESFSRRDLDAVMRDYDHDSVFDLSPAGLPSFEGQAAIRGQFEDWLGAYEEFEIEPEQIHDLGNGVVFVVDRQNARPAHSTGYVQMPQGNVFVMGGRRDCAPHDLPRHRRGPCCRRTPRRGTGVGDVAGERHDAVGVTLDG